MIIPKSSDDCREFEIDVAVRQLAHFSGQLVQLPVEFLLRTPIERGPVLGFDLLPQIVDVIYPTLPPLGELRRGVQSGHFRRGGGGFLLRDLLDGGRLGRLLATCAPGDCEKCAERQ